MTEHDDLERRLSARLDARAAEVRATPDTADLLGRVRRRSRRRQQVLGGALAVALAAGPVIGFQVGRDAPNDERASIVSDDDAASDESGDGGADRATEDVAAAGSPVPSAADPTSSFREDYGDGFGYGGYGQPMERVGVVDSEGVTIRLFRTTFDTPDFGNPTWEPPVGCFPTGSYVAEASTSDMVGLVSGEAYGLNATEGVVQPVGHAEGDPHWVAVGVTPATSVTVEFPDGRTVAAPVVDGVFTAATAADVADSKALVEPRAIVTADGVRTEIRAWSGQVDADEDFYRQCEPPPPALPPAGEQPADPDAARDEIVAAYTAGYGGGEGRLDAFVDPETLAPVLEALDESESFDQYRGRIRALVGEIVFDSPTHAFLFYDLDPVLSDRIGEAVLTDRGWKVANDTICSDVALAGVRC